MDEPIYILNGPNLNMLGQRQPEIYGAKTLAEIETECQALANASQTTLVFRQTNAEGELVTWVQEAVQKSGGLILNAAAYTHSSIALRDAVAMLSKPTIELHISNVFAREDFRHHSLLSDVVTAVMTGFGASGYHLALTAMLQWIRQEVR